MDKDKILKMLPSIAKWLVFLFLAGVILLLILFFYYTYDLPRPEKFTENPIIQSTKIYDRTGKVLLYDIYGEEKREIVSFDKISDNLKKYTQKIKFSTGIKIKSLLEKTPAEKNPPAKLILINPPLIYPWPKQPPL